MKGGGSAAFGCYVGGVGGGGVEAVSCDQLTQNNKGVGRQRSGEAS